ncbi:DUF4381 family protein [Methylobacterium persicinum]|uniref:DUF4381 domain-containing protein n=1 Tax=Methylobacterium persicinum TaxID=374426 RepID=A0ABU0HRU3_9HYPH|nr:DUF4381 family protein [Methylobacterium persicinum]MDQ0445053.1 hypothetical protein [Methylobacterium persicinum]GJE40677.1 hypothetical protein KHHGKMAE_4772 [Methylobacterium persicinum]
MSPADAPASLDQLRGLHLPGGASGPVPGDILLALILGFSAALLIGLVRVLVGRARASVRRAALADLAGSRSLDPPDRILAQARLLRRLVRTVDGDAAASAQGAAWAGRLDALLRTDFFTAGAGRVLVDGLYRRETPDAALLDAELSRLIGRLRA